MIVYYVQRYRWWDCSWIRVSPFFPDRDSAIAFLKDMNYDGRYPRDSYRIKEGV